MQHCERSAQQSPNCTQSAPQQHCGELVVQDDVPAQGTPRQDAGDDAPHLTEAGGGGLGEAPGGGGGDAFPGGGDGGGGGDGTSGCTGGGGGLNVNGALWTQKMGLSLQSSDKQPLSSDQKPPPPQMKRAASRLPSSSLASRHLSQNKLCSSGAAQTSCVCLSGSATVRCFGRFSSKPGVRRPTHRAGVAQARAVLERPLCNRTAVGCHAQAGGAPAFRGAQEVDDLVRAVLHVFAGQPCISWRQAELHAAGSWHCARRGGSRATDAQQLRRLVAHGGAAAACVPGSKQNNE